MKLNKLRLAAVLTVCFCSLSCKKDAFTPSPPPINSSDEVAVTASATPIFAPEQHTFTDIHICYDDKVFLLEAGKLKRLVGEDLVDVPLPASVYEDFNPKFLTISKDFTFYLRANTSINIIKGGNEIGFHKVRQAPLENSTLILLTKTIENKRLAIFNDVKTLYLAGKGLKNSVIVTKPPYLTQLANIEDKKIPVLDKYIHFY